MPKLLILSGKKKGEVFQLKDKNVYIGRDPSNTIFLPDRRASRAHAVIILQGNDHVIEDLGSVNGTLVNDSPITKHILKDGDEILLGSTTIKFLPIHAQEKTDEAKDTLQVKILPEENISEKHTVEMSLIPESVAAFEPHFGKTNIETIQNIYKQLMTLLPKASGPIEPKFEKADINAIQKAYQRLMIPYRISHDLNSIIELPKLFDRILELILEVIDADRAVTMLLDEETEELVLQSVRKGKDLLVDENIDISKTIINQVVQSGESLLTSDAMHDERFMMEESIVLHDIRSAMCVPIKIKSHVLGIMYLDTKGTIIGFSNEDLELLTAISNQAAIAVENAKLFESLNKANKELAAHQDQLIETERLSAMGRLAGGVAHEINNPMTSILGFSELITAELTSDHLSQDNIDKCLKYSDIMMNEAHRCKQIAQSLLQFSRQKTTEKAFTDINQVIDASLALAKFHIKSGPIEIITELTPGLPHIMADANQLQQVFLNLIINAKDAMEEGGNLKIITKQLNEKRVQITFEDTGGGIPADSLEDIFKPLYTSKEEGKGTGLGLSISQDIIERHEGAIDVKSNVGEGATFIIILPI